MLIKEAVSYFKIFSKKMNTSANKQVVGVNHRQEALDEANPTSSVCESCDCDCHCDCINDTCSICV